MSEKPRCEPPYEPIPLTLTENTALAFDTGAEDAEYGACFMATEYAEATTEIRRLMNAIDEQTARLAAAFGESYGFRVEFHYDGSTYYRYDENSYGAVRNRTSILASALPPERSPRA